MTIHARTDQYVRQPLTDAPGKLRLSRRRAIIPARSLRHEAASVVRILILSTSIATTLYAAEQQNIKTNSKAGTINLRSSCAVYGDPELEDAWIAETRACFEVYQAATAKALRQPQYAQLATELSNSQELANRKLKLNRAISELEADRSLTRKDEFETTAQFEQRKRARDAQLDALQARLKEVQGQIASSNIGAKFDAFITSVKIPVRIKVVTDTPTYDADRKMLSSTVDLRLTTTELPMIAPPGGTVSADSRRYENTSVAVAFASKVVGPAKLNIRNVPDVPAARTLKQLLAFIDARNQSDEEAWVKREGLVLSGMATIKYAKQIEKGTAAAAVLLGAGRRSEETRHSYVIDFPDGATVEIPEYTRPLTEGGMKCELQSP